MIPFAKFNLSGWIDDGARDQANREFDLVRQALALGVTTQELRAALASLVIPSSDSSAAGITADWPLTTCRVFAIDPANGNDAARGYADPATSSTADYAIACQAAGLVAKKTVAGFAAIFPQLGAGRMAELVIATGALAEAIGGAFAGVAGYASGSPCIRATGIVATAGVAAFDGSLADCTALGAVTAPGVNATGYTIIGAPTTTVWQFQKVGGGAAAFAAEPAAPYGYRIRGDSANTKNANVIRSVTQVTGTDTVTFAVAWPDVPVAGEKYYVEAPGVTVTSLITGNFDSNGGPFNIAGITTSASMSLSDANLRMAFCGVTSTFAANRSVVSLANSYVHPVYGALTVGANRPVGNVSFTSCPSVSMSGMIGESGDVTVQNTLAMSLLAGSCVGGSLFVVGCYLSTKTPSIGGTAALASIPPRVVNGAVSLRGGGSIAFGQLQMPTMPASFRPIAIGIPGIPHVGDNVGQIVNLGIAAANTSITGNNGYSGFTVDDARFATIIVDGANLPTVTGTLGDFQFSGGVVKTWAQVAAGFTDTFGNRSVS